MKVFLFSALFLVLLTTHAFAQNNSTIISAGKPVSTTLNTNPKYDYVDIYTRQLGYNGEQKNLKDQLLERQKNFDAPRREAYENYLKNREAMWKSGNAGNK